MTEGFFVGMFVLISHNRTNYLSAIKGFVMQYTRIPTDVAKKLGWYVYLYIDPISNEIFYVGKGKDQRVYAHLSNTDESRKDKRITKIRKAGEEPIIDILVHGLQDEKTAYKVEAAIIDLFSLDILTNEVRGQESIEYGRENLDALISRYLKKEIEIVEPSILIKISLDYSDKLDPIKLYDRTRSAWVVGEKREKAKFAFAVSDHVILEVYQISAWLPDMSTFNTVESESKTPDSRRWEFVGRLAPEKMRQKYRYRSVANYFPKGAVNPIQYVKID
jgi:hypothetical protein